MVNPAHKFLLADYCIFGVTIVVSLGIGIYYALSGGKQRTTSEYFVGNRKMGILPVAISLLVSFESSIMMLGTPAEAYVYGIQYIISGIGTVIANILSVIVVVPLIHPLKITSAYEYLELRFESHAVRILGTVLAMLGYIGYMGIVLFGPAIALEAVTGFSQWTSIISVTVASILYTSIGGYKAVIWTDVFQFLIMYSGFFVVIIKGTLQIGGVSKTWEIANENGRLNFFDFNTDPTIRQTFWSLCIGSIFRGFGLVFNQTSVQRISSTPTIAAAKKVLLLATPGFMITLILALIEGIIAYSYYFVIGCDPLASKRIRDPNQIIPYMVFDIFEGIPGVPGLFMASLFSASLSTLSSGLSALSAQFWSDLVQPHVKPMSEFKATVISKLSVVLFGSLSAGVALAIGMIGGTLLQIATSLLAAFGGPMTGLFMFGAFCPWGNAKGGFWGAILSSVLTFIITFGQMSTKGSVKNARLKPGLTDQCPDIIMWSSGLNITNGTTESYTSMVTLYNNMSHIESSSMFPVSTEEPSGFSRLFMVSFHWFGAIAIMLVIVFGTVISFCTGYKKPGEVDRKYIVPLYDSLCPFLPEFILRPLRCGYKYNTETNEKVIKSEEDILSDMVIIEMKTDRADDNLNNQAEQNSAAQFSDDSVNTQLSNIVKNDSQVHFSNISTLEVIKHVNDKST